MIDALFRFPVEDHDLDKRESDGGLATRGIASGNLSTATFFNFLKGERDGEEAEWKYDDSFLYHSRIP